MNNIRIFAHSRESAFGLIFLSLLSTHSVAATMPALSDPLFGISFDPEKIHFATAPATLLKKCRSLPGQNYKIFARYQRDSMSVYILNGYERYRPDGPEIGPPSYESGSGVAVVIKNESCKVISAEEFMSTSGQSNSNQVEAAIPPQEVLDGLVSNALSRMVAAYGSEQQFKTELSKAVAGHDFYESTLPPSVRSDYPAVVRKVINTILKQ